MGRYAHFTAGGLVCYGETHEYKFWACVQNSEIPWGKEEVQYEVQEYDEEIADDESLDEEEREMWRDYEGDFYTQKQWDALPHKVRRLLNDKTEEHYTASDDNTNLAAYWEEVRALAKELGAPVCEFVKDKDVEKAMDEYENVLCPPGGWGRLGDEEEKALSVRFADLCLKTTICWLLERWGSYEVTYET